MKKYFFDFYFSIVHTLTNNLLYGFNFECMLVTFVLRELCLDFCFMSWFSFYAKKRVIFLLFFNICFQILKKMNWDLYRI